MMGVVTGLEAVTREIDAARGHRGLFGDNATGFNNRLAAVIDNVKRDDDSERPRREWNR